MALKITFLHSALGALSFLLFSIPANLILVNAGSGDPVYPTDSLISPSQLYPLNGLMPSPRLFPAFVIAGNSLIVHGGYRTDGALLDDIHIFDIPTQKWSGEINRKKCCSVRGEILEGLGTTSTSDVGLDGDIPLARAEHAASSIDSMMYIFGGVNNEYGLLQDLYRFDPRILKWNVLDLTNGPSPARRAGHLMVSYGSNLIVYGGRINESDHKRSVYTVRGTRDVWKYDTLGRSWTQLIPVSNSPSDRQNTAGSVLKDVLYIFGGIDPVSNRTFSDLWAFHISSRRWQQLRTNSGLDSLPPLHYSHLISFPALSSASQSENILLLYGGIGSGGSCTSGVLINQTLSAVRGHFADAVKSNICDQVFTELGQLYRISIQSNSTYSPFFVSSSNSHINGVELDDLTGVIWNVSRISGPRSTISGAIGAAHIPKDYAFESVAYDSARNIIYEFGGLRYSVAPSESGFEYLSDEAKNKQNQQNLQLGLPDLIDDTENNIISISSQSTIQSKKDLAIQDLFITSPWSERESFFNIQPYISHSNIKFISQLRTYIATSEEIVLVSD